MYNNKRLMLSIFWIVLGAVLIALSVMEKLDSSTYSAMGGVLIAIGALQTIRNLRYRRDTEYRKKIDTEVNDERNRFLSMKSWSWTGYIVVLVEGIGVVVAMIAGQQTLQHILAYSVCLIVVVYWITYLILSRKY
ncbi:MAG: DUF2178 domain-containing protein [Clostridia bacterium]|nr:DUF2178 domain-containing protein [Clostridia bacterium]MBQ7574308.1 DUF2178 domain-containing protein [Clostridia bacterium]